MKTSDLEFVCCPSCHGELQLNQEEHLEEIIEEGKLVCSQCSLNYSISRSIPNLFVEAEILESDLKFSKQADEYSKYYDKVLKLFGILMLQWEPRSRKNNIQKLGIKADSTILDICTGPGNNLWTLSKYTGTKGKLVAIDLSEKMIEKCYYNAKKRKVEVSIHRGNGLHLPYVDNSYDVVMCSGGLNTFGDRKAGIMEMIRVTKDEGLIVISDEGLKPGMEETRLGKRLLKMNSLYGMKPPLNLLPEDIEPEVSYYMKDTMYQISFRNKK